VSEARFGQHVAVLDADHGLDVGGIALAATGVAVEHEQVELKALHPIEVALVFGFVPGGGTGEEIVPGSVPRT
jgi:hypothetical protein